MSHALVARLDSAGDVLITGPAVRAVAASHDRVTFLAGPRGREAAELLPDVDEVIEWQAPWVDFDSPELTAGHVDSLVKELRDIRPDRAFIFTSFHQSPLPLALICRMADVGWVGAISPDYPGSLLDLRHHAPDGIPEPERALSLAAAGGCLLPAGDHGGLRVKSSSLPSFFTETITAAPFVVFHPGAAVPARRPSTARSAAMVSALVDAGHRVVVTGGDDECELTAAVARDVAVDLGGLTTLETLAGVYALAKAVVVPNTGPAHLAAAVGAPVVSLFAPVVPAVQWMPYGERVIRLGDQDAMCRKTRARECPVRGHPCLDGITDAELLTALRRLEEAS